MTATTPDRPVAVPERTGAAALLRRLLTVLMGPLWVRTVRDPVREGHLRLDSLTFAERQLARFGLVALVALLGSVVFSSAWRSGTLLQLTGDNALRFLPVGALPVALLGLFLAWALLCWGALDATPSVQVGVAFVYVSTQATAAISNIQLGVGTWVLEHGSTVMRVGFYATVGVLVLAALLHPLLRRRRRTRRAVVAALRALVVLALLGQFGTLVVVQHQSEKHGSPVTVPAVLDTSITLFNGLLLPLVYVAAVTVIDFALDVSDSVTEPARVLPRAWLLVALVALLAVKVVRQVVLQWDTWLAELTYQPQAVARTSVTIALLVLLVAFVTRFPTSEDYALAKERAMYASSFVLAAPYLLSIVVGGLGIFVVSQFHSEALADLQDAIPFGFLGTEGLAVVSAGAVAAGVWLMRRSAGGFGDELGSALVVVGAWACVQLVLAALDLGLGFSYPAVDVLVTVGVAVLLALRWRRLSNGALVALLTLLVFSWLVNARGDYLSFLGGLLGLPAIVVVVFGVVLTVASGSSFASTGSRRLPTDARPLLWVGYLLLSAVILFWVTVSHEPGQDLDSLSGFYFIGIPMAAWLAGRRIAVRP